MSTPAADDPSAFPPAGDSGPVPGVQGRQRAQTKGSGPARPVVVGKLNPLLALLGLLSFVAADLVGLLPLAFAALPLGLLLVLVPVRWWRARHGQLEFGLLHHPLRRELRPYLFQVGNHWLFWGLFGAIAIATPTFTLLTGPLGLRLSPAGHRAFTVLLVAAAIGMAVLALVPRRRIYLATNLLVAIGWGFLAVQLVGINRAPNDPVVIDWPLAGEWYVIHGGRSDLINAHYPQAHFPSSDQNRRTPSTSSRSKTGVASAATPDSSPPTWRSASRCSRRATGSSPISPTPCPTCRSVPATTPIWKATTSSSTWVASVT